MKGNLLIVDDEEFLRSQLPELLEDLADKIFTAENGKEGLQILAREEIHCVVSDLKMPVMGGNEFIKEARAQGFNTPFIFFTGYGSDETMLEVSEYGTHDFIAKPGLENLFESVSSALESGKQNDLGQTLLGQTDEIEIMKKSEDD
ncbi:MAG: response regulator [Bacteriovoracaceae bacterium]|jgi:DNA-binding NtrC family response regulator|nr:response regulator [Bacteriovoracaceae bacterium]